MNKAVFLDRDNTIVEDNEGYIDHPNRIKLLPGTARAIYKLNNQGLKIIVISNQSGIGRKFFSHQTLSKINQRMIELLAEENAKIDDIFFCPHKPEDNCTCRKPFPGMLLEAASKHKIDLSRSFMIGNSESDILAGKSAGCKTILLSKEPNQKSIADFIVPSLNEAVEYILLM